MISTAPHLLSLRLKPGELLVPRKPAVVTTVLGSCVAVTMFNARRGFAAICHAMLPEPGAGLRIDGAHPERFKYVIHAIPTMTAAFRRVGLEPAEIEVKMFGGGTVIGTGALDCCASGVGPGNLQMARMLLEQEDLSIAASNVGGRDGRKIVFNTVTGEVLHKHLT